MDIELTVEQIQGWAADLKALTDRVAHLFRRPEPRQRFADLITGLLATVPRKNSWQLAEHAGHPNPDGLQWLLNGATWNADTLRDHIRDYLVEHLGSPHAVLVFDDTQAIKKGTHSVGVARQYCGATGQVENCQTMVMCTYASPDGHAFLDRELYLPKSWTEDPDRCQAAGVPPDRGLITKPHLAIAMLDRILTAAVPFRFVTADAQYGRDPAFRQFCHQHSLSYVLAVPVDLPLTSPVVDPTRVDHLLAHLADHQWERRSCGPGTKGTRTYDWATLAVTVKNQPPAPGFTHLVLVRRSVSHPDQLDFFLTHAPTHTPIPDLITTAGLRWKIEENNQHGKDLLGLDQYQVRKWTPWYRHVTCCMFAHAFLTVTRAKLGKDHGRDHQTDPGSPHPSGSPLPRSAVCWPASP